MRVIRGFSTHPEQPLTSPWLDRSGVMIEWRGGDVCHPRGNGDWFRPPYFAKVFRAFVRWPVLPFLSVRFGRFGFYVGAKGYGVDSPAYRNWLPGAEVFTGSQAIMLSVRFSRWMP